MQISKISIAVTLALFSGPLVAAHMQLDAISGGVSAAEFAYTNFVLSKDDGAEITSTIAATCPKKSDDSGSIFSAEARKKTACLRKQVVSLEKRHKRDYDSAKSDLSEQTRKEYDAEYLSWVKTRYANCQADRSENPGSAMTNAAFASCQLYELKRRAKWRGVKY